MKVIAGLESSRIKQNDSLESQGVFFSSRKKSCGKVKKKTVLKQEESFFSHHLQSCVMTNAGVFM